MIFEFEGTSGGPCRELILSSRAPLRMLPVHCYCCLLKKLKLWLRLKLRLWLRLRLKLWLVLHSAQKQGKRGGGGVYMQQWGKRKWGKRMRLVGAACTDGPQASSSQPHPLPLPFASSCSPLSCLSLCSFSRSRC